MRGEADIRDRDIAERTDAVEKLFVQKLNKDANLMIATMRAMMTNQSIERAFRDLDRPALSHLLSPLFASLRDKHHITHLYFTGPDLINLYRFHSPDEFGEEIEHLIRRPPAGAHRPAAAPKNRSSCGTAWPAWQ